MKTNPPGTSRAYQELTIMKTALINLLTATVAAAAIVAFVLHFAFGALIV